MAASAIMETFVGCAERGVLVLDAIFVGLTVLFFVVAIGYVALCERLMD